MPAAFLKVLPHGIGQDQGDCPARVGEIGYLLPQPGYCLVKGLVSELECYAVRCHVAPQFTSLLRFSACRLSFVGEGRVASNGGH